METKSKGLKEQQQHHKKLLAAMLSQDSFDSVNSPASSVVEEEIEDEDDAMELLGNVTAMHCFQNCNRFKLICRQNVFWVLWFRLFCSVISIFFYLFWISCSSI